MPRQAQASPTGSQAKRHQTGIRCPFCNAAQVEISDFSGRYLGVGNKTLFSDGLDRSQGVIYTFAVYCEKCQRTYSQAYPANLMPLDFQLPA
jgi:hypothetical protein